MARLFVNVDHVATLREARRIYYPDPLRAALLAEEAGAAGITVHLREDRRHIQDHDVRRMKRALHRPFNFELAVSEEIVRIAEDLRPEQATLVPEKREEITTEGGLDLRGGVDRLREVIDRLKNRGTLVSLFIDPEESAVETALELGASHVELHTGRYANASGDEQRAELEILGRAAARARTLGLEVNAGHGLHYENAAAVAAIPGMNDLNIGHAIVAEALYVGFPTAVRRMAELVAGA
ncbi:MAG: pyridoxine 5'-phosphate synthase [Planctomycetes bacterium]|nr:pyridoxine 5'-phosphate synthase [Planctomycetota bacterium]